MKANYIISLITFFILLSCTDYLSPIYENQNDPNSDNYKPSPPSFLNIKSVSETFVELNWYDHSAGEKGFILERKDYDSDNFIPVATIEANRTLYRDNFILKANKEYCYRINAIGKKYSSKYSDSIMVKFKFYSPSDFTITTKTESSIELNWKSKYDFELGYNIYSRDTVSDTLTLIATITNGKTTYLVENLDKSKIYTFYVSSFTQYNESSLSKKVKVIYGVLPSLKNYLNTGSYLERVEFSPNNNDLLISGTVHPVAKSITIWDPIDGVILKDLGFNNIFATYHPDGRRVAIAPDLTSPKGEWKPVYIYDTTIDEVIDSIKIPGTTVNFSHSGNKILISRNEDLYDNDLAVYDLINHKVLWKVTNKKLDKARFTKNDDKIICRNFKSRETKIVILNSIDGSVIGIIEPDGSNIEDFAISDNGNLVAFSISDDPNYSTGNNFEVWDLNTMQKIKKINPGNRYGIRKLEFGYDDEILAVSGDVLHFYRTSDFEPIGEFKSMGNSLAMDFNLDGSLLAIAGTYYYTYVLTLEYGWTYYIE